MADPSGVTRTVLPFKKRFSENASQLCSSFESSQANVASAVMIADPPVADAESRPAAERLASSSAKRRARPKKKRRKLPVSDVDINMSDDQPDTTALVEKDTKSTVYCYCRKADGDEFMIGCDHCDRWFHGICVNISQEDAISMVRFFCRDCVFETGEHPQARPFCCRPACKRVARQGSKYCGHSCGLAVAQQRVRQIPDLSAVIPTLAPSVSAADEEDLMKLETLRLAVARHQLAIKDLSLKLARLEDLLDRVAAKQNENPKLPICGYPCPPADELCTQPLARCPKHAGWQRLRRAELEQERSLQRDKLEKLQREEELVGQRIARRNAFESTVLHETMKH